MYEAPVTTRRPLKGTYHAVDAVQVIFPLGDFEHKVIILSNDVSRVRKEPGQDRWGQKLMNQLGNTLDQLPSGFTP